MNKGLFLAFVILVNTTMITAASASEPQKDWRSLLEIARSSYAQKDYSKAILFYETALPLLPKSVNIAEEIAQTHFRLKQFEKTEEVYAAQKKMSKETKARIYHNRGNIALNNKSYDQAINHYKTALRNNPLNERTRYNLSEAIRRKNEEVKKNPPPEEKDDKKNEPKDPNGDNNSSENPSALSDNSVQRELDKLMKKEAATKRKITSGKEDNRSSSRNAKDW